MNNLGSAANTNVLAYKYSTDQTLHWADPLNGEANVWNHMAMPPEPGTEGAENYLGPIPAVVHLHGGEVPPVLDGGPDAWFTSDGSYIGHAYYSRDGNAPKNYNIYRYPNSQEGSQPGVGATAAAALDWTQPSSHRAFIIGAAARLSLRATVVGILPPWLLIAFAVDHILIFEYLIRIKNQTLRLAIMR